MTDVQNTETKKKFEQFSAWSGTVADAISEGYSEIEEVGSELREAYDNAPDNLKGTDVNERRDSTASTIEGFSEPDVNDTLGEIECSCSLSNGKVYRGRQTQSRSCRAGNGAAKLRAAAEAVREWAEGKEKIEDISDPNDVDELRQRIESIEALEGRDVDDWNTAIDAAEELASACEEIADEVDNLDFPGMMG